MIVGFLGAQGTGKSTLIKALKEEEGLSSYITPQSPSRYLHTHYNFDLSGAYTDLQLSLITMQYRNSFLLGKDVFLDRTVIDNWTYMTYFLKRGQTDISSPTFLFLQDNAQIISQCIDKFIFLRPSFPLVEDGVRVANKNFQLEIDMGITLSLHAFNIPTSKILEIKGGTVAERVDKVRAFMVSSESISK